MIPLIIGAVAIAGTVAYDASGKNSKEESKNYETPVKREVSEDYVKRYLKQAGKSLNSEMTQIFPRKKKQFKFSGAYPALASEVECLLAKPRKSNEGIKKVLKKAERRAKQKKDARLMKDVAGYYQQIRCEEKFQECYQKAILWDNKLV